MRLPSNRSRAPGLGAVLFIAVLGATRAAAQDQPATLAPPAPPPALENLGKPMLLPFQCTAEDIHWAGLSCTEEDPCPIYLELTAAESAGTRMLVAGNIHSSAVTLYSVLLASEDGGRTWREAHERIRGAGLDRIQFLDAEMGWISGEGLFPLPQDPFLLLSVDGGKTWRQRPIFSESRLGSIQQFFFTGKSGGSLIVDRGLGSEGGRWELYESPDAGENWLIKEESHRPLKLKRSPPPPDWRARPDGPTQSFHIERRQGERWHSVAAFAVKLSACKPPHSEPPAPPPEPAEKPPAPPAVKKK